MKKFIESRIQFEFDEQNWDIIQYDAHNGDFRKKVHLANTKAVDFIGIYNKDTLVLFEIKSFRGYGDQKDIQHRLQNSMEELSTEIAQKVRDTIAAIAGFNRTLSTSFWGHSEDLISNKNKNLMIIAWIEEDNSKQKKVEMNIRLQKLQQKLNWVSTEIYIDNIKEQHYKFDGLNTIILNK